MIETKKKKTIANYSYISKKIKDRIFLKKVLYIFLFVYRDSLNLKLNRKLEYFDDKELMCVIIDSNSEKEIVFKLLLISKYINYVDYNLNTNLLLDRFIIEFVGENYE